MGVLALDVDHVRCLPCWPCVWQLLHDEPAMQIAQQSGIPIVAYSTWEPSHGQTSSTGAANGIHRLPGSGLVGLHEDLYTWLISPLTKAGRAPQRERQSAVGIPADWPY